MDGGHLMARRRSGKKIDFVHWTGMGTAFGALAAGTIGATGLAAQHDPETLLRYRGTVAGWLSGVPADGVWVTVSLGMILVPEGTGATVLWSPFTDADAPWIWFEEFDLAYDEYVTDVVDAPTLTAYRSRIDNKAMRIVRNQEIQFVAENTSVATGASVNVSMRGRILSGT